MPKVERLPSGSYRIRFTDPWGRRAVITRKTAADTRAAYRRALGDMARGEYVDVRRGRQTVASWADEWLAGARNLSRGGHDTYRRDLDRHILPALGQVRVGQLSASDVDRYLTEKNRVLAPSTVHRHYRTLHRMLEVARLRGLIAKNPCEQVEPPKVPKVERQVLDPVQVDALADAITPRYRAWVYVMCYGGLRWSESIGLRRGRVILMGREETDQQTGASGLHAGVDLASEVGGLDDGAWAGTTCRSGGKPRHILQPHAARLQVVEQLIHRGRGVWDRVEPKAGSRRTVTLPAFAAAELAAHLDRFSLPGPDGLVFPTGRGTPVQSPSFTANVYKRALRKAGLPDLRIHDLRHTAVSLAIDAGANVKAGQARAGHASSSLHLDLYAHRYPAADEAIAVGLEELRAKALRGRLRAV